MTKSKNALDGSDQEQYSAEQSETNLTRAHRNTCWPSAQLIDVPGRDVKHRSELSFSSLRTHQAWERDEAIVTNTTDAKQNDSEK
jgi:hypothetical protein